MGVCFSLSLPHHLTRELSQNPITFEGNLIRVGLFAKEAEIGGSGSWVACQRTQGLERWDRRVGAGEQQLSVQTPSEILLRTNREFRSGSDWQVSASMNLAVGFNRGRIGMRHFASEAVSEPARPGRYRSRYRWPLTPSVTVLFY